MASLLRKLFGPKKKRETRKDSITGRNKSFPVPYLSRLEGNQLQSGQSLIVRGFISGTDEFLIELTSGPCVEKETETDVLDNRLLCIRTDIPKQKVFLNACVNGEWGKEAAVPHSWRNGDEFDIRVRCCDDAFYIYVEHKLMAKFAHYVPMSNISHIYVNGAVQLYNVSWEGKFYAVPYSADIPGNFFPGRRLFLSGVVSAKAKQFSVDFCSGNDVVLRIQPSLREKVLHVNSRSGDKWGQEHKIKGSPIKKKRTFDLLVVSAEDQFTILVNDVMFCTFENRLPGAAIDRLQVEGDVELLGVHLK